MDQQGGDAGCIMPPWHSAESVPYIVGLRYKTRSHALTIGAEDALIAALKAKHAKPDATITYVRKSNRRWTAVFRMKDCRIRNEISLSRLI